MKSITTKRRVNRIRSKLKKVNKTRLRLSVFKSAKNIYAQIIDDANSKTMVSASSVEKILKNENNLKKSDLSTKVAENLAERAKEKKINKVFFDRGRYRFHGRIKRLAEVLRKKGMEF